MKAKLVNEAKTNPKGRPFGEQKIMELMSEIPFVKNPKYVDFGDRDNPDSFYGQDENYAVWDFVEVDTEIPNLDDTGVSMLIAQETENSPIGIKFYCDSIAFNGQTVNDEYMDEVELVDFDEFSEQDWKAVIRDLKAEILQEDEDDEDIEDEDEGGMLNYN